MLLTRMACFIKEVEKMYPWKNEAIALNILKHLEEFYPKAPYQLFHAIIWLVKNPDSAQYLCGEKELNSAAFYEQLEYLCKSEQTEYIALLSYRDTMIEKTKMQSEKTEENHIKRSENESK